MLTLVADIRAKPGQTEALRDLLAGLVAPTRAEEGCVRYDLHVDQESPDRFVLLEDWKSVPLWNRHMASPHLRHFGTRVDDLVAEWRLTKLSRIG